MKKQWKCLLALGMTLTTMGGLGFAADGVQTTSYIVNADKFQLPYAGNETVFNHKINPGYGSALALKSINKDGTIEFYAITDRGPNGDIPTYVKTVKKCPGSSSLPLISHQASVSSKWIPPKIVRTSSNPFRSK